MQGLYSFRQQFGCFPEEGSAEHQRVVLDAFNRHMLLMGTVHDLNQLQQKLLSFINIVSCPNLEFQPFSALIASFACIQACKLSGQRGGPVFGQCQFAYFNLNDLLPVNELNLTGRPQAHRLIPKAHRQYPLEALFGTDICAKLRNLKPLYVGSNSFNFEVAKSFQCIGVEQDAQFADVDTGSHAAFGLDISHQEPQSKQMNLRVSPVKSLRSQDILARCDIACCDSLAPHEISHIDTQCRIFRKPYLIIRRVRSRMYTVEAFTPQCTATFPETELPMRIRDNSEIFPFDFVGRSQVNEVDKSMTDLESRILDARALFHSIFCASVRECRHTLHMFVQENDPSELSFAQIWQAWSVVQRGYHVKDFSTCIQEAWKVLEVLPFLHPPEMKHTFSVDLAAGHPHVLDLLSLTACLIAESVQVAIPEGTCLHFA